MNKKILIMLCMVFLSLSFASCVSITDVSSNPAEVAPGGIASITLEIENIFNYDVYNLNVKLDLSGEDVPFAPYQSSSEKFLDKLRHGDDENFKFKLIALPSTPTGIYKIPVEISYTHKEGNDTPKGPKTGVISVTVNSEPELKIYLEDSDVLIKGKENTFSIRIINSGLADVKFVYLIAGDAARIEFISEQEQYMGDIDSDDFDSAEFKIYLEEDASNSISLPVILKFKDATNKEFQEVKTLTLKTYSLKEAQSLGLVKKPNYIPYIVIGVLVIGYFVRRYFKKRKLEKSRR